MSKEHSNQTKESDALLRELFPDSSGVRREFREELRTRVIARMHRQPFNFSLSALMANRHFMKIAGVSLGVVVLSVLGLGGTYGYLNFWGMPSDDEILSNVLANNSNTELGRNRSEALTAKAMGEAQDEMLSIGGPGSDIAYYYSKTTYERGAGEDTCPGMKLWGDAGTEELWNYFGDTDASYYSKMIAYDSSGRLLSYTLSNDDGSYEYRGGDYAVLIVGQSRLLMDAADEVSAKDADSEELTVDATDDPPADDIFDDEESDEGDALDSEDEDDSADGDGEADPSDTDDDEAPADGGTANDAAIDAYFGQDVEVIGRRLYAGKFYIVIESRYEGSCEEAVILERGDRLSSSTVTNSGGRTVINRMFVDPDTYEIRRTEVYVDSTKGDNLIYAFDTEIERRDTTFSAVSGNFEFDYDVDVRTIDVSQNAIYERALDVIQEYDLDVLVPVDSSFAIQGIDSPEADAYRYQYDRSFYPSGSLGNKMYEEATAWIEESDMLYSVADVHYARTSGEYNWDMLDLYVYGSDVTIDLFAGYYLGMDIGDPVDGAVVVDGKSTAAKIYTVVPDRGGGNVPSFGGESDVPEAEQKAVEEQSTSVITLATFMRDGYRYVIMLQADGAEESNAAALKFTTIDSGDRDELEKLVDSIEEMNVYPLMKAE